MNDSSPRIVEQTEDQLANAAGIGYRGLDDLARNEFGKDVRDLTKREASALIDELRE